PTITWRITSMLLKGRNVSKDDEKKQDQIPIAGVTDILSTMKTNVTFVKNDCGVEKQKLNAVTKPDAYLVPRIADILDTLGHSAFFSILDLMSEFWQTRQHFCNILASDRQSLPRGHLEVRLKINMKKCDFFKIKLSFLGHVITVKGMALDLTKVEKNHEYQLAFDSLKKHLISTPIMTYLDFSKRFTLVTDASDWGIGAVLSQKDKENHEHPVAYASRLLITAEQNYTVVKRECLVTIWAIRYF
ncbi:9796_t:CDS:2, partial [Dentiscutata erythropus]